MALRNYIDGATLLTLSVGINNTTDTVLTVASTAGYPATPFTIALERGTVNEEVCLVTGKTGTTFTVTRAFDGTTIKAHSSGTSVEHATTAADYRDANAHVYDTTRDDHTQYANKSLWAAKGTVLVASGAGVPAALAVGGDSLVLIADSTQTTGVRWGGVAANQISASAVTFAKLDSALQQKVIQVLTTGTYPGSPAAGEVVYTTDNSRWEGYVGAVWQPIPYGVGKVTYSTGAPSGGADGDVWLQYV